jgi:hypothetical protein
MGYGDGVVVITVYRDGELVGRSNGQSRRRGLMEVLSQ